MRKHPFICATCHRQTVPATWDSIWCASCEQRFEAALDNAMADAHEAGADDLFAAWRRTYEPEPGSWLAGGFKS